MKMDVRIEVKNLRKEQPSRPTDFRIDRMTCLGNPYKMVEDTPEERKRVCIKYAELLLKWEKDPACAQYKTLEIMKNYLREGKKVKLYCWCAPKTCHGHVIEKYLKKRLS